ncbi:MAG: PAS domain S-box protein, partial [Candidatus Hydrogenedentes bacterium]|nr:PAS domain S-box protein [Candidatus Hydrogenedentota bacterium]
MKLIPKKVESRIFLLILIICLSMSLLAARLIVISQESAMIGNYRSHLASVANSRALQIQDGFSARIRAAVAANEVIQESLSEARERKGFIEIAAVNYSMSGDVPEVTTYLASPDAPSITTQVKLAAAQLPMQYVAPIIRREFTNFYVAIQDEFTCISPSVGPDMIGAPNEASLREKYAIVGPAENPERDPVWSPVEYDPRRNEWLTSLLVPLYDGERFLGLTGSDYALNELFSQVVELIELERLRAAYILNSAGEVIAHPYPMASILTNEMKSHWQGPLEELYHERLMERYRLLSPEGNKSLYVAFEEGEVTHMAYVSPIGAMNWLLAVVTDDQVIEELVASLRWKLMLSAVFAALILVFLLRACFRQLFIDRVVDLEHATRAFTEFGIVDFPQSGNDEIGGLVFAFKEMVQSLASREAELTVRNQQLKNEISGRLSAVESLRESERKFRTLFEKSSDAILVFDGERLIDCNEAAVGMLDCESKEALLATPLLDFAPEFQPDGTLSSVKSTELLELVTKEGKHRYEWVGRTAAAREFWVDALITRVPYGGREVFYMVWRDITSRKEEDEERVRLTTAIEQAAEVIIVTDPLGTMLYVNPSFERLTGYTREEALGSVSDLLDTNHADKKMIADIWATLKRGDVWKGRVVNEGKDKTPYQAETTISPVRDASGVINNFVIVSYDVTKEATLEAQLLQAHKMEAIGELASGIAHEINTPTQYIGDNIRFFQESFSDIKCLLDKYQELLKAIQNEEPAQHVANEVAALIEEIELDYLNEEVPLAIEQSLEGNSRVAEIVRAMKEFAHPGLEEMTAIDVNHAINNTIAVARNEWKYVADVVTDFDPDLPEVPCLPGSFNQVMLNILVNAAHAIA